MPRRSKKAESVQSQPLSGDDPSVESATTEAEQITLSTLRCNFCNKPQCEVGLLIAAPQQIYICDECVILCIEILLENNVEDFIQRLSREPVINSFLKAMTAIAAVKDAQQAIEETKRSQWIAPDYSKQIYNVIESSLRPKKT